MPVSLVCLDCKRTRPLPRAVTGAIPACPACGGRLALRAATPFQCRACGVTSKPALVDLTAARGCPKCRKPLEVADDPQSATAATIDLQRVDAVSAATIAGEAPGFDPARVEFISGTPSASAPGGTLAVGPRASGGGIQAGTFGRYTIVREVARGGMGIVYEALDPTLHRTVALKVLIAGEGATDEAIRRFIREARAASALRHPGIVTVYDAGEIDGQHYFTMDFVQGHELAKIIGDGREPLEAVLGWIRDACLALHHAHERGIIHRDLKPANIMVDREGRPLVMDFGLARDQNANSMQSLSGNVSGTPAYMSPEQARGQSRELDRRTDVYSMGVVLYEAATRTKPFSGDTLFDTIRAVVNDEPRPPVALEPDLGADLNTIILKCLEKRPERRYQTMQELADDLDRFLRRKPIAARPLSAVERFARRVRRDRRLSAALIAVPTVAAAILIGTLLAGDGFLAHMRAEVASGDASRMAAAATSLDAELRDGRLKRPADREAALILMRRLIGGTAPEAEARAIPSVVASRDAAAVPALVALASDASADAARRQRAIAAITSLAGDVADRPATARALGGIVSREGESVAIIERAASALKRIDADSVLPLLGPMAKDAKRPAALRIAAIGVLAEDLRLHDPAMPMLLALQGDRDRGVADAAEAALAAARDRKSVLQLYGVQERAGQAAAQLAAMQRAVGENQRALEDELERADAPAPPEAPADPVSAIATRLRDDDAQVRAGAAFDLGQLHDAKAIPHLLGVVSDRDVAVRRGAGRALVKLSPLAPVANEPITAALSDPDARVREDAATLLGELEAREALPALIGRFATEPDEDAAIAIAEAVGRIGDARALPVLGDGLSRPPAIALACVAALRARKAFAGDALPQLARALASTSRAVREAAATALHDATGEDFGADAARWKGWIEARKK